MKSLLLAALAASIPTAVEACTLSEADLTSLAASPSHLTASEFAAAPPIQQKSVCSSRAFIAHVDAQKGVIKNIEGYNGKYLTAAENARIVAASNALIERQIMEKGR